VYEAELRDPRAGAYVSFEGWVRNHQHGRPVLRLEYEAYADLALKEGGRILEEARERFRLYNAACVHRTGALAIGDAAVWVGAVSAHRDAAFDACRYIIDEVKVRVPIWKKEYYEDGYSGWVNCENCAAHAKDK
jgi:molybdopterin synthase catalytic subunit